jgi:hypothetical protein
MIKEPLWADVDGDYDPARLVRATRVRLRRHDRDLAARNPLFAAWLATAGAAPRGQFRVGTFGEFMLRTKLARRYAFAVPSPDALACIARYGPILQIGAGTGYWALLLRRDYGVDIRAYDARPPRAGRRNAYGFSRTYAPVLRGGVRQAARFPDRTLFLCWPPLGSSMAANCLTRYTGSTVIVIGEDAGGCTANDRFFELLDQEWTEIETIDLPQWEGIHDDLRVFRRAELEKAR